MGIVRFALKFPYTFYVLATLVLFLGSTAILSMPMLAITKIICDRVRPLAAFGHFLEG